MYRKSQNLFIMPTNDLFMIWQVRFISITRQGGFYQSRVIQCTYHRTFKCNYSLCVQVLRCYKINKKLREYLQHFIGRIQTKISTNLNHTPKSY